jgi:hypothetical protein
VLDGWHGEVHTAALLASERYGGAEIQEGGEKHLFIITRLTCRLGDSTLGSSERAAC